MKTKFCNKCKTHQPVNDWPKRPTGKFWFLCRKCKRMYDREYYHKTKNTSRRGMKSKNQKTTRERNHKFIMEYLNKHPCVDCGERDTTVLEFDHLEEKKDSISNLIRRGYSIKTIKEEIDKCVVRCCNCHRRKTAKDFGWRSWRNRGMI